MYINKAIESVDGLYPNEYSADEKYMWCDELSAKLTQELKREYGRVTLESDKNGDYLLPENISFEMIDRIFDGQYQLDKQDFRADGVVFLSGINRRIALPKRLRAKGNIDVIYLRRHEPIRRYEVTDVDIEVFSNGRECGFRTEKCPLRKGDVIKVTVKNKDTSAKLVSYDEIYVMDIRDGEVITDRVLYAVSGGGSADPPIILHSAEFTGKYKADITRHITDKTVCDAPYDSMYIDYLLAKICYYQHDYESYNQHMTAFNGKYRDYEMWLKEREPLGDDGKMKNWW